MSWYGYKAIQERNLSPWTVGTRSASRSRRPPGLVGNGVTTTLFRRRVIGRQAYLEDFGKTADFGTGQSSRTLIIYHWLPLSRSALHVSVCLSTSLPLRSPDQIHANLLSMILGFARQCMKPGEQTVATLSTTPFPPHTIDKTAKLERSSPFFIYLCISLLFMLR
ncbi:hypothetical protein BD626DRAFT_58339 [Schizophyllum amplum]|uniref:Uncharacterized protein n=1 Tax=Schizophyllum amplum TaxID=97359 RepID=A0A550CBT5_9AGAR|nr:hypothetical protein BD626DRAFT_58339 [Auriculariopsis ampla]